ncbi:MAG TPA: hypothetical protein VMW91_05305 [Desulfosporosinus sp.]|nr:hypothetical protein [Desulfosporosinus sp.]
MKKRNWSKAKAKPSAFAANMGTPTHRKARKAPAGMKGKKK